MRPHILQMGRDDGYSPHKDRRRSERNRSSVYKSLGENSLGVSQDDVRRLIALANDTRDREHAEQLRHRNGRYPTRSTARFVIPGESTEEDDEDECARPTRRSTRHTSHVSFDHGDDEESRDAPEGKSSILRKPAKRRRIMLESEDDEPNSSRTKDDEGDGLYDRVKSRHKDATPVGGKSVSPKDLSTSTRSSRHERRSRATEEAETTAAIEAVEAAERQEDENEEEDSEEEEEEMEEEKGPRQYPLRERREIKAVDRFGQQNRSKERNTRIERRSVRNLSHKLEQRIEMRKAQRDYRRRVARSDSSSTDATDDEAGGSGTKKRGSSRRDDDDERFEQRKEKSMAKSRQRFLPINISAKELSTSSNVVRERLRQAGASCSDIDPMSIDNTVLFDQVGGLDAHLQTLKEVVLFPMLYPEIFDRFKINPPKGCIFYGPPGTGKTLVARALANECAKGAKKVAFFMRKGADCLSKWVGESERQLRLLFDQAYAMRPSIIFFDEIDGLAPVRSSRQDQIHASIVSTLLALMDGLDSRGEVVVIGATNRLDTIDPALRRPGRFDRELKFSLPDASARRDILDIHTKEWGGCKPAPNVMEWLADGSSGYCGADLKFLCTEAVLIALRERYPHIYMSSERLLLDPNQVVIEQRHLQDAMRRITPASRRDLSIPCRPMEPRTQLILRRTLDQLMNTRIPAGYRQSSGSQNGIGSSQLEKVVKALESAPVVPAVRLLLTGKSLRPDTGQSSFLLPALLSKLDHLPIFSLAVGKLFADGRPEETLAQTMQSALRAAASTPAILLLPNIDQWYAVVPPSVSHMLATALDNLTGFTSLLLLATCDGTLEGAGRETPALKGLFRTANAFEVPVPSDDERRAYMEYIMKPALVPPNKFDPSAYPAPPVATADEVAPRKLSDREITELKKLYEGQEREFRIFLRDILARLMRDRRFHIFNNPVEEDDAPDYYEHIKQPMCMSDMMGKIDSRVYRGPEQFVEDINLIMRNALEYNPPSSEGRVIRHNAVALRDMCDALLDMELDEKFVEKMQESARLLKEAGVKLKVKPLPFEKTMPQKFTRSAAAAGFVNDLEEEEEGVKKEEGGGEAEEDESGGEEEMDHDGSSTSAAVATPKMPVNRKKPRRRSGTYSLTKRRSSGKKPERARSRSKTPEEDEERKKAVAVAASAAAAALDEAAESMDSIDGSSRGRASDESTSGEERKSSREEMRSPLSGAATSAGGGSSSGLRSDRETRGLSSQTSSSPEKSGEEAEGVKEKETVEEEDDVFKIDEKKMKEVVEKCTSLTRLWPAPELERLAAALIHEIDLMRECWDRRSLPDALLHIAEEWHYEDE
ncbi:lex-1 [Pristionchus pacificus]|nr:lex-1 [Pristionchus pacificus]